MKKTVLASLFALMGIFAFAEVRINVTQSIRYGNGSFATMDNPQISREKARKDGGKVYLRYDFEVNRGFWDGGWSNICIGIRFPSDSSEYANESVIKVTALSGAKDARLDVLDYCKEEAFYPEFKFSIGRLPTVNNCWLINRCYYETGSSSEQRELVDYFEGILLIMPFKNGQKASIEFYIDFAKIESSYESAHHRDYDFLDWAEDFLNGEIPIDITFHAVSDYPEYSVPNEEYRNEHAGNPWNLFWIFLDERTKLARINDYVGHWKNKYSYFNHSFTLMVSE